MLQSPNYIHLRNEWQILGLDAAGQWPDRTIFQKLMEKVNDLSVGTDFDDFSYKRETCRCEMGKLRSGSPDAGSAFSKLVCGLNQMTFVEEWAEDSADGFRDKSVKILSKWFETFPNTAIIAQKCCLRALVQPATVNDSRFFLGDRVMNIGESMKLSFKSMPFRVGFTFTCLRKTSGYGLYIDTTINSWRDNNRVWIQVEGTYPMEKPINATNIDSAKLPFNDCKGFLEEEVLGFIGKFDERK
jgi:hypothetical protein